MPVYRIEKTVATYAYAPPGEMDEVLAEDLLKDAEMDGGGEEDLPYFYEVSGLDEEWREALLYHRGQGDLTGEEALKLP